MKRIQLLCGACALMTLVANAEKPGDAVRDKMDYCDVYGATEDGLTFVRFGEPKGDPQKASQWQNAAQSIVITNQIIFRAEDRAAFRAPNELKFVEHVAPWGPYAKLLFCCAGGAFGQLDYRYTRRLEMCGTVDDEPTGITQFPKDTIFVLACPKKGEIVLVDCVAHTCNGANQPKKSFPFAGVSGVEWDVARDCLWALGPKTLRKYTYALKTTKEITQVGEWDYSSLAAGGRGLRLTRDGVLHFIAGRKLVDFDPKKAKFAVRSKCTEDLKTFTPSIRGDLRFVPGEEVAVGDDRYVVKGMRFAAACIQPIPTSELH